MANTIVKAFATGALLYAARRYFRDWGTTKAESSGKMPGDELLSAPVLQATEAVWIDAGAESVWPWLVQMGQERGGLYSFEKLENAVGWATETPTESTRNGSTSPSVTWSGSSRKAGWACRTGSSSGSRS